MGNEETLHRNSSSPEKESNLNFQMLVTLQRHDTLRSRRMTDETTRHFNQHSPVVDNLTRPSFGSSECYSINFKLLKKKKKHKRLSGKVNFDPQPFTFQHIRAS